MKVNDYQYDPVGKREIVDGINYASNNMNEYTNVGGTTFQYDLNGNLTNEEVHTYAYDYENRLVTASGGGHNSSYAYDGFGRRLTKTVDGVTTNYLYDADRVIEERDASNQLIASYVYGDGIDEILTMARGAQTYYYFYDGLGSVTDITDTNGEVIESYAYDVYGMPNQLSTIGNRFYFTGREYDSETGLYYYRARYYSPMIGRFLQKDPITWTPSDMRVEYKDDIISEVNKNFLKARGIFDTQLLHNYNYVANSPINRVDPFGLWYIDINVSLGGVGRGITGGLMLSQKGIYKYAGFGINTPGPGASLTFSRSDPTVGWNAAFQVNALVAYQQGRDYRYLKDFNELGIGFPGASFTMFYVDKPWKWPWLKDKKNKICK